MIVWIASYPKSGNTFLRILLAEYLYGDLSTRYNFSSLNKIEMFPNLFRFNPLLDDKIVSNIKDLKNINLLYRHSIFLQKKLFSKGTHFLKTHSSNFNINNNLFTNTEITSCALYLIRDPRNIISSYAEYQNKSLEKVFQEMTTETIQYQKFKNEWYPICHMGSWQTNYLSWRNSQLTLPVKIIKYEDLVNNTNEIFLDILIFLSKYTEISIDILKIKNVVEKTEFNNLQKLENDGLFKEMNDFDKNNKFFKLGLKRDWKTDGVNVDLINNINHAYQEEINSLGY